MVWLQNAALRPIASSAHKLAFDEANPDMLLPLVAITQFDVILMLREGSQGLVGCCVYKPHLFRATMIDRLLGDFRKVLELMLAQPERPISTIHSSLNRETLESMTVRGYFLKVTINASSRGGRSYVQNRPRLHRR